MNMYHIMDCCSICLEPISLDYVYTPCIHKYHRDCLLKWVMICESIGHATPCPICRADIKSFGIEYFELNNSNADDVDNADADDVDNADADDVDNADADDNADDVADDVADEKTIPIHNTIRTGDSSVSNVTHHHHYYQYHSDARNSNVHVHHYADCGDVNNQNPHNVNNSSDVIKTGVVVNKDFIIGYCVGISVMYLATFTMNYIYGLKN
jgi:Ring finger domain